MRSCASAVCRTNTAYAVHFQEVRRLWQQHGMGAHQLDVVDLGARQAHQTDPNPHECLVQNVQPAFWQQPVNVRNPAISRVLDRQHGLIRLARAHGRDDLVKGFAGHGFHIRSGGLTCLVGIGARLSLKGDSAGHFADPSCGLALKDYKLGVISLEKTQGKRLEGF